MGRSTVPQPSGISNNKATKKMMMKRYICLLVIVACVSLTGVTAESGQSADTEKTRPTRQSHITEQAPKKAKEKPPTYIIRPHEDKDITGDNLDEYDEPDKFLPYHDDSDVIEKEEMTLMGSVQDNKGDVSKNSKKPDPMVIEEEQGKQQNGEQPEKEQLQQAPEEINEEQFTDEIQRHLLKETVEYVNQEKDESAPTGSEKVSISETDNLSTKETLEMTELPEETPSLEKAEEPPVSETEELSVSGTDEFSKPEMKEASIGDAPDTDETENAAETETGECSKMETGDSCTGSASAQSVVTETEGSSRQKQPNIVIMLADDIGMGDLGCFGNTSMKTPNIDQLAREGAKLTQNLAAASVCTPSRAAMLTGRYPVRIGMAPSNIVRVNIFVGSTGGLPAQEITLAELAKEKGYGTAWIGKWHMGVHCGSKDFCHHPNRQGFDHFYGLPLTNLKDFGDDDGTVTKSRIPNIDYYLVLSAIVGVATAIIFRKTLGRVLTVLLLTLSLLIPGLTYWTYNNMTILNAVLMRNMEIIEQPIRLHNRLAARLANEAADFIKEQTNRDKPFLLVVGWVQAHTSLHTSPEFAGVSAYGEYGDNVEEMDWSVGQVMKALKDNKVEDNTLVYFASDNGAHNEETGPDGSRHGGWNGIYRGGKAMGGMEGGVRVPGVVRFPGRIPAGKVIDTPVSLMDMYTTSARLIGADLPTDRTIDGTDILPLLEGTTEKPPHDFLFHYCGTSLQAARYSPNDGTGDVWKVHYATPNWEPGTENCLFVCGCYFNSVTWHDPPLLYNLAKDPSERSRLDPATPKHAAIIKKLADAVATHKAGVGEAEDQMGPFKLLPLPALQPCCGTGSFPNCDCSEPPFPAPTPTL